MLLQNEDETLDLRPIPETTKKQRKTENHVANMDQSMESTGDP